MLLAARVPRQPTAASLSTTARHLLSLPAVEPLLLRSTRSLVAASSAGLGHHGRAGDAAVYQFASHLHRRLFSSLARGAQLRRAETEANENPNNGVAQGVYARLLNSVKLHDEVRRFFFLPSSGCANGRGEFQRLVCVT